MNQAQGVFYRADRGVDTRITVTEDRRIPPPQKTQRSVAEVLRRKAAAERTTFVIQCLAAVLVGTVLAGLASWAFLRRLLLIGVAAGALLASGCSSVQVAEADIYQALVVADEGVTWAAGHETEIKTAIKTAMAVDPKNQTLQNAGTKALTAVDNGDLGAAFTFVRSARVVFSPAPTPVAAQAPSGQ